MAKLLVTCLNLHCYKLEAVYFSLTVDYQAILGIFGQCAWLGNKNKLLTIKQTFIIKKLSADVSRQYPNNSSNMPKH